jgi:hypothetical protein
MSDGLNFDDLTPVEIPVTISGKSYFLLEATGDASCKYRNAQLAATQLGPDGKPIGIRGMADVDPLLVSLCLVDENRKPVSVATIRAWPARVLEALAKKVKSISGMDEVAKPEEALKNEPDATLSASA